MPARIDANRLGFWRHVACPLTALCPRTNVKPSAIFVGLLVTSALARAQAQQATPDPLQARVWAAACLNCHAVTEDRASGAIPTLADRGADELLAQLLDFKAGRRPATVMHQLARGYGDDELRAISIHLATYFAARKPSARP